MATKILQPDRDSINSKYVHRFWRGVDKHGPTMPHMKTRCWVWKRGKYKSGYGSLRFGNKCEYTHRISWEMEYGTATKGMLVCHKCDNRACVRPGHLFLGTHKDNTQDMWDKGRQCVLSGEDNPRTKLSDAQVKEIIIKRKAGRTLRSLGKEYGVTHPTIGYRLKCAKLKGEGHGFGEVQE